MLDIRLLRENLDVVRQAMANRHTDVDLDALTDLDRRRRETLYEVEQLRAAQNRASDDIARLKKAKEDASEAIAAMKEVSARIKVLDEQVKAIDAAFTAKLLVIPNIPHDSVPVGASDADNRVERQWGEPPKFDFEPKDHVDLGEALGILDFECAAKLSGARFSLSRGAGSLLERALINFMLDVHTREHGYTEILPPFAVNSDSMQGTGQLPKFASDLFKLEGSDLWLIPTAEVPVTNIHRDDILAEEQLPVKYAAYTPCFRSEAGSYGKDTRGMIRVHQFNKVEMVKFTTPETSWAELESLTANAETILQRLGLAYRVVTLSSGDLGFSAAKTYDIEVWLPGQSTYREISSCSNFTDFQARRANIRFRRDKKPLLVHTLNGSGLAVGRTAVAVIENYQQADGSVVIPKVLRPYMHGMERIEPCR
ncbi:MAG TPA: serine--tRNA ligase [Candidatus Hydrogenedentes bacterium]|nr:serine--tRNA ligase [Candidatus Hydrogenedentota bacterium]HPG66331.1 serine--tRNA ligase [Candidatus Hydrogenedentota bacterium]